MRIAIFGAQHHKGAEILRQLQRYQCDVTGLSDMPLTGRETDFPGDIDFDLNPPGALDWDEIDTLITVTDQLEVLDDLHQSAIKTNTRLIDASANLGDLPVLDKTQSVARSPHALAAMLSAAIRKLSVYGPRFIAITGLLSVSGLKKEAMDELFTQTRDIYSNQPLNPAQFPKQIAFNMIPWIGQIQDDNRSDDEHRLESDLSDLTGVSDILSQCIQAPVFAGHSAHVTVLFDDPLSAEEAEAAWRSDTDILVADDADDDLIATPVDIVGDEQVYIGRIRDDASQRRLSFWMTGDNLRSGLARPIIEALELPLKDGEDLKTVQPMA